MPHVLEAEAVADAEASARQHINNVYMDACGASIARESLETVEAVATAPAALSL